MVVLWWRVFVCKYSVWTVSFVYSLCIAHIKKDCTEKPGTLNALLKTPRGIRDRVMGPARFRCARVQVAVI